ncbi:MAG: CAAD domain-containing protein [Prochlorococcaceae cyanobacterium]
MTNSSTDLQEQPTASDGAASDSTAEQSSDSGAQFAERYSEIISKVNQTLDQVDWSQMGRVGKAAGVILAVIVAQILIKGVLDTINLLPVVPGLLELLGLVIVGQWSWQNLTTSEKRSAVITRLQNVRKEYLG